MKKKRFKSVKKIFKSILILIIFGIVYSFAFSTYENIKINNMVKNFKNRATNYEEIELKYSETLTNRTHIRRYWVVPRETLENDNRNVFNDEAKTKLGQKGDIFTTRTSPFPKVFGFHQFMTYYFGGHAAIYDDGKVYEATGYPNNLNEFFAIVGNKGDDPNHGLSAVAQSKTSSYWTVPNRSEYHYNMYYRKEFFVLRVKGMDDELADAFIESANEKVEDKRLYNFLFFLNMKNKYYCTDFVSRSYEDAYNRIRKDNPQYRNKGYAKMLNDDGFITSVNDLILAKDTYISFYFELEETKDGTIIENYYYLEDVN